jgi:hypothetical protein
VRARQVAPHEKSISSLPQEWNHNHRELFFATGKVTNLELYNAITNQKITDLTNGKVIVVNDIPGMTTPSFNIRAVYSNKVIGGSVVFGHNAVTKFTTDSKAPYSLCAEAKCAVLGLGNHTVTATPHARCKGRGRAGQTLKVSFTIVQGGGGGGGGPVVPTARDVKPPRLLNFTALSTTKVDVTAKNGTVFFELVVEDEGSYVAGGSVEAGFKDVDFEFSSRVVGKPLVATIAIPCSKYLKSGIYPLTVYLYDGLDNGREYRSADLSALAFASKIEIVNAGAIDTTKPVVVSVVATSPTKVDVSAAEAKINFQVTVSDAQSGLSEGGIECLGLGLEGAEIRWPDPVVGRSDVRTATLTVPRFTTPGECTVSARIVDDVGNSIFVFSNIVIAVTNSQVDADPPKLVQLKALTTGGSAAVNVTDADVEVQYEIVVRDDKSGYVKGAVCMLYPLGLTSCDEFASPVPSPGAAQTATVKFLVKRFLAPGLYPLALEIADGYNNQAYFNSTALASLSFPSVINVVNLVVDTTPPELVTFAAVSSATVTVTKAVRVSTLEVKVVVSDSQSGFAQGRLILRNAANAIVQTVTLAQDDPLPGQPVTFYEYFKFDQKAKTGTYQVQVELLDGNGNLATISTAILASRGFLNTIQVNGV